MSQEDTELLDTTNLDENELDNIEDGTEDVDVLREQLEAERQARLHLTARAKRAEAELKQFKTTSQNPTQNTTSNLTPEDIRVEILRSEGTPSDEIEELKTIAKMKNITVIEAKETTYFKAYKAEKDERERSERAKLGVSTRSGQQKAQKTFNTPGLSPAEHKQLWLQSQGR